MIQAQPAPAGARCALHPSVEATATCSRCGNYTCVPCTTTVGDALRCVTCKAQVPAPATELSRLAAMLIDSFTPAFPVGIAVIGGILGAKQASVLGTAMMVIGGAFAVGICGFNLYLVARNSQSFGKRMMRIRVLRTDYEPATFWRIVLRRNAAPALIGAIPVLGGFFSLTDAAFIFRADKRCIHDHIADTIVVESEALSLW